MPHIASIDPAALHEEMKQRPVDLIDVRTPAEFRSIHAVGARNLPLDRMDPSGLLAGRADRGPLYVICHSGARAYKAAERLAAAGFDRAIVVEGGTQAWRVAGLPSVKGLSAFSVERQAQLTIGLSVLTGAILALTVSPWFALVSAFFGAGLAVAGITGRCQLAVVIGSLPWNRSAPPTDRPNPTCAA
jgi:rhodanese-related sulfurtransferase